jgi:hypothetical protein
LKVFDFVNPHSAQLIEGVNNGLRMLPDNSIVLTGTPYTRIDRDSWADFYKNLQILRDQYINDTYVFIDASWDPLLISTQDCIDNLSLIKEFFPGAKVAVISSRCQHWFDAIPGLIYYPAFGAIVYNWPTHHARSKRIGCLNRASSPHRLWLMHSLLSEKLIDPDRDIYSMSFASPYNLTAYGNMGSFIEDKRNLINLNNEIKKYPPQVATHPDNFPNDYTIEHPAWHTAIAVVTETHPGDATIISEKTAKAIISKSCFSIYMSEAGYRVLEELGFEPRFFADHASETNIEPIKEICRQFDTESAAMDYRQSQIHKINHNFEWFSKGPVIGPWYNKYQPKLQRELACL